MRKTKWRVEGSAGDPGKTPRAQLVGRHSNPKRGCGRRVCNLAHKHFSPCFISWFVKLSKFLCGAPKENIFGFGHQRHAIICCADGNFGPTLNTRQHVGFIPAKTDQAPHPRRGHRSQAKIPGKCDSQTSLCIGLGTMATGCPILSRWHSRLGPSWPLTCGACYSRPGHLTKQACFRPAGTESHW